MDDETKESLFQWMQQAYLEAYLERIEGVNLPKQERSRRTVRSLLQSTARQLDNTTVAELSIRQILSEAECSMGAFYKRFESMDNLIETLFRLFEAYCDERLARVLNPDQWRGSKALALIEAFVVHITDLYATHGGLMRAFLDLAHTTSLYQSRIVALIDGASKAFFESLRVTEEWKEVSSTCEPSAEAGTGAESDPIPEAVHFASRLIFAVLDQQLFFGGYAHDPESGQPDPALRQRLLHVVTSTLAEVRPLSSSHTDDPT